MVITIKLGRAELEALKDDCVLTFSDPQNGIKVELETQEDPEEMGLIYITK